MNDSTYRSVRSLHGRDMEKAVCDKLDITQTLSRGPKACQYDGVDDQDRRVEIKTIGVMRNTGQLRAGRMAEKKKWCDRLIMEYNGRLFDTAAHSNPEHVMSILFRASDATFNPGLEPNDKNTRQNINTKLLLECEIEETV